jgi:large subunit ribosomal protein L31
MKKQGHPKYRKVLFVDTATGFKFACGSTMGSDKQEEFEGQMMPVVTLSISSSSHPYFVGGKQFVDTEGRVDKFNKRYLSKKSKEEVQPEAVQ